MTLLTRIIFCSVVLSLTASALADDPALAARIRGRMQTFIDRKEIAGAVTLVGDADAILSLDAVGLRSIEGKQPMQADTLFRVASMTKPITAMGVMMLVDEGKLAVDDPIEKHLPEFQGIRVIAERSGDSLTLKPPARAVTIRDLMTHTSGLPDASPPGFPALDLTSNPTLADAVKVFAKRPLSFEPGTQWAYSNAGMAALGRLIEVVSGHPYPAFLKERLFDPLGMPDTTFYPTPEQMRRTAVTYDRKGDKLTPVASSRIAPLPGIRYPNPAGGLYSTAPDLARLYRMVLRKGMLDGRRYLSESSLAEMTRLQTGEIKTGFTDSMGYGLGFGYVRTPTGVTEALSPGSFGHGGAWGTQAWIDARKGRFAVLLIQRVGLPNSDASPMRREFQKAAFE
jgi:CubicO group peptidase (beta-lactamase class C family)